MVETEITESLAYFAVNTKHMRESQGVKVKEVAEITGLTDTYIFAVENQRANISINNAHKIAMALRTPLHVLLLPPK